ncbi:MAG: phosphate/phosphite/phosphonate ABC transporter substrate-binding protein [Fimbriiglobus sp.]|jgi:ABC-type phosphate/phosphonate transport system substrate-binding protein|nr:phosphate/phosphite/phosphonate ABC transporter substrate-binding protein [Fimbriiglobus sp.]
MHRLVLSILFVATAATPAPAADPGELRIGMLSGMFRDQQPKVVQALAKPFRDLMTKNIGYTGDVEVMDDPLALCDKLRDNKVQLGVFHGFEFAWAQQRCDDLVPLIVTCPPGGCVQGLVVVHDDCPAKTLADLKGEVLIPRGAKAHTLLFLEKHREGLAEDIAKPTTKSDQTPEDVLNSVASGTAKAALVDFCALDGYKVLQPGAHKSLRVLARSEQFPPAVVCYRKGSLSDEQASRIRDGMANSAKTPTGKMLMTLWNLKGFEPPPKSYQGMLDDIVKVYPAPKADAKTEVKTGGAVKVSKEPGRK